jgi:hypothetical protein
MDIKVLCTTAVSLNGLGLVFPSEKPLVVKMFFIFVKASL